MKIIRPRSSHLHCTLVVLACSCLWPAVTRADAGVAVSEAVADEDVVQGPATVALLRGRWEGQWQQADGSIGQLRMQISQADENRIVGVLRYHDTAYRDRDAIEFDVTPVFSNGDLQLSIAGGPVASLHLRRSGSGYRLSWSGVLADTGQAISHQLAKGAVTRRTPPDVAAVLAPVPKADPGSKLAPGWHRSGAFMQIYVRGYRDSNGDGIGDLNGVTAGLDYLQQLGVKGIWLMPIQTSQDHDHGYAVMDYRAIEPAYGSTADFKALLAAAHKRGIGVIMDYVMNHSAVLHPVFANAASSADNRYRNWYIWQDAKPEDWSIYGKSPWYKNGSAWYFGGFGGGMPDWNLRNREVVDFHLASLRYWLNLGVDGFRFDAVGNLVENGSDRWESQPENYALMREVRAQLDQYRNRYLVCEAPNDPVGFADACGSAFAFGNNKNLVKAGKGLAGAIEAAADYPLHAPATMATMLSNHDSFAGRRIFDQTRGDLNSYRMAAATYLLQPGIPFVYYGEEIGMAGGAGLGGDGELRTPMSWTAAPGAGFSSVTPFRPLSANAATFNVASERAAPDSLYHFYRALLTLRSSTPALARGSYEQVVASAKTLSFQRREGNSRVVVLFNYDSEPAAVSAAQMPAGRELVPLYPVPAKKLRVDSDGRISPTLAARSVAVYRY